MILTDLHILHNGFVMPFVDLCVMMYPSPDPERFNGFVSYLTRPSQVGTVVPGECEPVTMQLSQQTKKIIDSAGRLKEFTDPN